MKAIDWINHLNMSRHPEGGYYKEIFRSEKLVDNDKSAMTSIYYLLENEDKSAFHRLTSPEVWYYRSEERRVGKECRSRWSPYH